VAIYLLASVVCALPIVLLGAIGVALYRWLLRIATLSALDVKVSPGTARPGERIEAHAKIVPRGGAAISIHATLGCTMFDHRARRLYTRTEQLAPVDGRPNEHCVILAIPENALRTGVIGDDLSSLFSEEARRLLVFWDVSVEVRRGKRVVARRVLPVLVPEGRPLKTDERYMSRLVVETFASIKDDMLLNWLVKLAAEDGTIAPAEREFLHDLLRTAHNITSDTQADARIQAELERRVDIDPALIRRHIPAEQRVAFYRLLYAVAWRDGVMDKREHAFLVDALRKFGLDRTDVSEVEKEVLRGVAQSALE
jgi:uncharacterized tellurite resistance protein B-like protein